LDILFEELDYSRTALGELVLRRRTEPKLGIVVIEVKLGDEFLMSSLFTAGETALANLGVERLGAGPLDIVVGGLGLGYTAAAVLAHESVRSLLVIEALEPVIRWHRTGLLPLGAALCGDPRCELALGDFFALAASAALDSGRPGRRFHGIFVDIDHSPRHVLSPGNASFYEAQGLRSMAAHLHPGGVFALWSNDPPEDEFSAVLATVFTSCVAHVVTFVSHAQKREVANTVYVARAGSLPA
jgi:spermidine synthase